MQKAEGIFEGSGSEHDLALGFGQDANLLAATAIHDALTPENQASNYNVTVDRWNRALPLLLPA